jgi:HD-like signal output (HDOD) protein/CheY-like chemotaxis protein
MKVLFVDDEEAILSGLRRMLRRHAADWETSFAVGGEAALSRLSEDHFDVVVTDMRMPGIDGADVLNAVRGAHPGTVRIVLSGHNEMAAALRTVPLAHQFLTKPCDPDDLRAAVNRATRLQEVLTRTELLPVIGGVDALPSPPAVIHELGELLAAREVEIDRVIDVVSADPAISAKLLQLVNSAFFGVARRVGDVGTAVRYLGIVTVRDLAVAVHAFRSLGGDSRTRALVQDIHTHSSQVAELTQLLVGDDRRRHEAFVAALLHDVGRLVLASRASEEYADVVAETAASGRSLQDLEAEAFGATHSEVGALFLSLWGLPYPIVEVVLSHHQSRQLCEPFSTADATYLAELLLHARAVDEGGPGLGEGPFEAPPADVLVWPTVARAVEEWRGEPEPES